MPNVWTIHALDSEWAQCNCTIVKEDMICKHTIKVFKIFHPGIDDNVIVHEVGAKHGVDCATLMSQSFMSLSQQSTQLYTATCITTAANVKVVMQDNVLHVGGDAEYTTCGFPQTIIFDRIFSSISFGNAFNSIILFHESSSHAIPAMT